MAALLEIAREISGTLELTECLNHICRITGAVLGADRSSVILWSSRKQGFVAAADVGTPADVSERFRSATFDLDGSSYMARLLAGEIVVMTRESCEPIGLQLLDALRLSTQVTAPFFGDGVPAGALTLGYTEPVRLQPEDLDLLRGIAQQAGVAIKTARLFTNMQKAAAFRASLSELAVHLSRERDLERVIQRLCDTARRAFDVGGALLALADGEWLRIRGTAGAECAALLGRAVSGSACSSPLAQVFHDGRTVFVNRYRESSADGGPLLAGLPLEAVLLAPLMVDGRAVGVLVLPEFTEPHRFSDLHVEEATILAATAGAWIENSRLLTALRQEGQKLSERTARLEEANRALEWKSEEVLNANRALEDLIYVASHDLRAPLINLEGFAHELTEQVHLMRVVLKGYGGELLDSVEESVRFIRAATTRMDALVQGLLDVSRCGMRELVREAVDVNAVVTGVLDAQRFALSSASITVHVDPLPTVSADAVGLSQVFAHLIDNAIKYMGDAPQRTIEIGAENGAAHRFFVRDSGPGISPRDQNRIFRLFQRGGQLGVAGDGIGLTVVKKIIERHGGVVWVESELGAGSTFWISLPLAEPQGSLTRVA